MKQQRKKTNFKKKTKKKGLRYLLLFGLLLFVILLTGNFLNSTNTLSPSGETITVVPDWIDVQLIDIDGTSRRGVKLEGLNDIVVHYVGNPNTTAEQNRNFYANKDSEVSSHFVVGLEGEVIQCIPLDEKSSATNWRNKDTISIEVCHPDDTGKFTEKTYASLVKLTAWLCEEFQLDETRVIRHFDVTGKECPRYFVQHEDAYETFLTDIKKKIEK